MPKDQWISQ